MEAEILNKKKKKRNAYQEFMDFVDSVVKELLIFMMICVVRTLPALYQAAAVDGRNCPLAAGLADIPWRIPYRKILVLYPH